MTETGFAPTPGVPKVGLQRALALCRSLLLRAAKLKEDWVVPGAPVDHIVLATGARSEATFGIVIDLVGRGFGTHATALSRTMVEDCEIAHWLVASRPDDVDILFNDYWDWQNLRLQGDDDPGEIGMDTIRAEELRRTFRSARTHWTRRGGAARRRVIRAHWVAETTRRDALEHLFTNGDVWANAMLHHSPWGLAASVSHRSTVDEPRFVVGPSWLHSWAALRFAYLSMALLLSLCDECYSRGPTVSFNDFIGDDGVRLLTETRSLYDQERARAKQLATAMEAGPSEAHPGLDTNPYARGPSTSTGQADE